MNFIHNLFPSTAAPTGPIEFLIVGLGNPGSQYEHSRHNAGFHALDVLAASVSARVDRLKFKSLCGDAAVSGKRVLLMKPQTFMNNSGEAVRDAMAFYKIPTEHILVISDDISLAPGKVRIRAKGSAGGHNGLKNIIYLTGKDNFPRIKVGVGEKPAQWDLADWVLAEPKGQDAEKISAVTEKIPEICALIVQGKTEEAMNRFNAFQA